MSSVFRVVFASLIGCVAAACVSAPKVELDAIKPGAYQVEKSHASLTFQVKHFGLSWYTMRFNEMDVALDFDPANPTASSVTASIDPTSIDVYHPDKQADWERELANEAKFLNAGEFPEIRFTSTDIALTGENTGIVTGDLFMRGETKPISMDVTFNGTNAMPWAPTRELLGFSASGSFNRSDFGITTMLPNAVSDEVRFMIEIEFEPS